MSASAICAAALALVAGLALGAVFLHGPAAAALAALGISGAIPAATGSSSWASNGISESSSGSLFRAVRVRTFDGARQFGGARAPSAPTLAPAAGELRCRNWAATTTIFEPSDAVRAVAALPSWCLVVAADKKGPAAYPLPSRADGKAGAIYLTVEMQEAMPFATRRLLRWNHFGRKNLAFLYAIQHGARYVFDFDDDNDISAFGADAIPLLAPKAMVAEVRPSGHKLYNLYPQLSTNPHAWPRGFPLDAVKDGRTHSTAFTPRALSARHVGVLQSLADHDPDVDGIYRLTQPLPFYFPHNATAWRGGAASGRHSRSAVALSHAPRSKKEIAQAKADADARPTARRRRRRRRCVRQQQAPGGVAASGHDDAVQRSGDPPLLRRALGAAAAVHRPRTRHRHLARVLHAAAALGPGPAPRLRRAVGHAAPQRPHVRA